MSASGADDLLIGDRSSRRISIVPPGRATAPVATIELTDTPVAVLPMRLNGDAVSDLVVFQEGTEALTTVV